MPRARAPEATAPEAGAPDATQAVQPPARGARAWMVARYALRHWAVLLSIAAAVLVASTVAVVIRTYTPLPKWGQWDEILWLKSYYSGHWRLSDLWRQVNEHRIFFPRLFFLTDLFLLKGTAAFLLVSMLALQAGHAWVLVREVRAWRELSREIQLTVAVIIVALFFSGANLDNFTWGYQLRFILVFYAATLSIRALILYAEVISYAEAAAQGAGSAPARGAGSAQLAASVAWAAVATYSFANGILIWPVLLLTATALRLRMRILLRVVVPAAIIGALYFSGYHATAGGTHALEALKEPLRVLEYVCAYLALPLSAIHHVVGVAAGFAALIGLALENYQLFRAPASPRLVKLSVSVMLFIAGTALVTALGRMALGRPEAAPPETAALRYATPASIFWACALLVLVAEARRLQAKPKIRVAAVTTGLACLIAVILPLHVRQCARFLQAGTAFQEGETALLAGVSANDQIGIVDQQLIDVLRAHKLSLFAREPAGIGEALQSRYQLAGPEGCHGSWEAAAVIKDSVPSGESASGWAWDAVADQPPAMVLITDNAGVIRGLGRFTRTREDVAAALLNSRMKASGWFGFARLTPGDPGSRAYALLSDRKSVCALRPWSELRGSVYAVFRRGQWLVDSNRSGSWESEDRSLIFGLDRDYPVAGDWDGSGAVRAGVFRNGEWFLDWNNNGQWDESDRRLSFGLPGDLPVVGDWNHSGTSKLGVFRHGTWILDWNGKLEFGPNGREFSFGLPGDIPVAGDWDGSGKVRIGVFRRGEWYLDMNGDFRFDGRDKKAVFGREGDQPVTGDWNGLGVTGIGVFRNGQWILDTNGNMRLDPQDRVISFGQAGDVAVAWPR